MCQLNLAGIIPESVADGPGIRFAVFAQGCRHGCPGCFNQDLQPFGDNKRMTVPEVIAMMDSYGAHSITLTGGDPFEQSLAFAKLAKICDDKGMSIWCYTGYTYEQLCQDPIKRSLLRLVDVLVDGRFIQGERDLTVPFRGSRNQRLISVKQSLQSNHVILYDPNSPSCT